MCNILIIKLLIIYTIQSKSYLKFDWIFKQKQIQENLVYPTFSLFIPKNFR